MTKRRRRRRKKRTKKKKLIIGGYKSLSLFEHVDIQPSGFMTKLQK